MELMISPPFHILKGLTLEEVVAVAIETVSTIQETKPITIGIVLYVTPQEKRNKNFFENSNQYFYSRSNGTNC